MNFNIRKVLSCTAIVGLSIFCLTGCKNEKTKQADQKKENTGIIFLVTDKKIEDQFELPKKGEEIAKLNVKDYGEIKFRFFEEAAPKAVKNFKELAKKGKYNGVKFHRVIEDFMIQTGGTSESIFGKQGFECELNQSLRHFNGAVCMARNSSFTNGQSSQFYIVSSEKGKKEDLNKISKMMKEQNPVTFGLNIYPKYTEKDINLYKTYGGAPTLDMLYTVFGQVLDGLDVVQAIASCEKKQQNNMYGENSEPANDIILENVEIIKYQ